MEWINSEDKLPPREQDVLVYHGRGRMDVNYRPKSRGGDYAGDDGKSWYPGGSSIYDTHWMLLPDSPKD